MSDLVNLVVPPSLNADEIICQLSSSPKWASVICSSDRLCDHLRQSTAARVIQSGASSHAKHGGAYFSAVRGSIKDPIAVPGRDEVQEC